MPEKPEFRKVTLCLLLKGHEVLLAMKKRGFGVAGRWEVENYTMIPVGALYYSS